MVKSLTAIPESKVSLERRLDSNANNKGIIKKAASYISDYVVSLAAAGIIGTALMPPMTAADTAQQYTVKGTALDYADMPVGDALFFVQNKSNGNKWHGVTGNDGRLDILLDTMVGISEQQTATNFLKVDEGGISYNLVSGYGKLSLYNLLGQRVSEQEISGNGSLSLDKRLGSGVYFVVINSDNYNAVSRLTLMDGNIIGARTEVKRNIIPFLSKPSQADVFSLNNVIEGYEDSSRVFVPGVDFTDYSNTARVNMIPSLISALPDTIEEGYDVISHFKNDDAGILTTDNKDISIIAGRIAAKLASPEQMTIPIVITYTDAINPSLEPIIVESIFRYSPLVSISGRVIDTDMYDNSIGDIGDWTFNPDLQGWVCAVPGDTAWANSEGEFSLLVPRSANLDSITAGYKKNGEPASFIRTIRDIPASEDVSGLDIVVVSYGDMNTTPEEFRIMAYEANFRPGGGSTTGYEGAKALDKDNARWVLIEVSERYGHSFTDEQWNELQRTIREEINPTLRRPLPIVTYETPYYPEDWQEAQGMILIEPSDISSIGSFDINGDGVKDFDGITLNGLFGLDEETISALVSANFVEDPRLEGKTILYEWGGGDVVTPADRKLVRFIECITHGIGGLYPKMPIGDVLRLQYQ